MHIESVGNTSLLKLAALFSALTAALWLSACGGGGDVLPNVADEPEAQTQERAQVGIAHASRAAVPIDERDVRALGIERP